MRRLGVIGGLGPLASAYFLELLTEMTDAKTDQDHIETVLFSRPTIPDRTAYLLRKSAQNPLPSMLETAKLLEASGADLLCAPCVTSHAFFHELSKSISLPWIHMVQETVRCLRESGVKTAGILATSGTVQTGLFQSECQKQGIHAILPSAKGQQDIMHLIYQNMKAGLPPEMERFCTVSDQLFAQGCDALVLGCTELSLLKRRRKLPRCLDALEVLARRAVLLSEKPLKQEYQTLL